MPRYFTHYWKYETFRRNFDFEKWCVQQGIDINTLTKQQIDSALQQWQASGARGTLDHTAGNLFRKSGVTHGDFVYVWSFGKGRLMLLGRLQVDEIVSYQEAKRRLGNKNNIWKADEHIIAMPGTPTPIIEVFADVKGQLQFIMADGGTKTLKYRSLNQFAMEISGVRELTPASAALFDNLLGIASKPKPPAKHKKKASFTPAQEETFVEGEKRTGTRTERNPKLRAAAKQKYGLNCYCCGFRFEQFYGKDLGADFAIVHHLETFSGQRRKATVDDVRVVCANCHYMIHRKNPPVDVDKLRAQLSKKWKTWSQDGVKRK